ncbi:uncharacterized protein L969DRAFT_52828 [Mixia osmundae IAM 14324]|uniref:MPN domain-containing protein n=1 Tax=Mixia osmundae (strain CBS 9802 / IAM 14324 / JCM 22182 / KY 12970) TaxID=764103 RepID=G7DS69_MIXOS|nr:uncharacterized protein L969DRAFT_52828 [Mixia osmundae IAM 14324]KEI37518.1 hypothetical protein L969DRAFT_52828 [Mixia osmundae IAM 14324]GAA93429.1 hypothetical protein E5Q_00070 [Mixia osmundae IAM 14324]
MRDPPPRPLRPGEDPSLRGGRRPATLRELADFAASKLPYVDGSTRWMRSALELYAEATTYRHNDDNESAYILLVRCARILDELEAHEIDVSTRNRSEQLGYQIMDDLNRLKLPLVAAVDRWQAYHPQAQLGQLPETAFTPLPRRRAPARPSDQVIVQQMDQIHLRSPPVPPAQLAFPSPSMSRSRSEDTRRPSHSSLPHKASHSSLPRSDRSSAPKREHPVASHRTFTSSSHAVASKIPLRWLALPKKLPSSFVSIAKPNTKRNLETCGLLLGRLERNELRITTLLVPKQRATADTCATTHEEEILAFQTKHDLLTLGWIHTHPVQSCFMSSLDLHTQASYQAMLPEAIAVVCSPKSKPDLGYFRLTDPPGLQTILHCRAKDLFHPHAALPLYTDAHGQGHLRIVDDLAFRVHDLR